MELAFCSPFDGFGWAQIAGVNICRVVWFGFRNFFLGWRVRSWWDSEIGIENPIRRF
jgi:hypothetical protein